LPLSAAVIARSVGVSAWSVRRLRARLAHGGRPDPLRPDYHRCGRRRDPARQALRLLCAQLRRQHPRRGAGRIRLELPTTPGAPRPGERTVQRWLTEQGLAPPPVLAARPAARPAPAAEPHDSWQMDAKERVRLLDGSGACWLRLVD